MNSEHHPIRILFELRPALEGYAGIPQETRLLFRGLCTMPEYPRCRIAPNQRPSAATWRPGWRGAGQRGLFH